MAPGRSPPLENSRYGRYTIRSEGAWMASNRCAGSPAPRTTCPPVPTEVRRAVGYAHFAAQQGEKHEDAKVLKGFGDAAVLEVIARHDGDTFRAVYTVRFGEVVYVLHVFQKKSKRGSTRPKKEL